MIYIHRDKIKKPQVLTDDGDKEHLSAHKHYETDKKEDAFPHKLFKDSEVKDALVELFNGKCAYCESKVTKTAPIDKEHFRPKTKIKIDGTTKIRGYYWLAAEWQNLLSACANCNRTGTHETDLDEKFVSGKLDSFPLSDESKRAAYGSDLKEEEKVRLLINPCIDKPETIIQYNKDGEILPLPNISAFDKLKVITSVETFGLQRSELHKDRREKWLDIQVQVERIKKAFHNYMKHGDTDFLVDFKREFSILKTCKSNDKEHLAVVRYVIRQELSELKNMLVHIKNK